MKDYIKDDNEKIHVSVNALAMIFGKKAGKDFYVFESNINPDALATMFIQGAVNYLNKSYFSVYSCDYGKANGEPFFQGKPSFKKDGTTTAIVYWLIDNAVRAFGYQINRKSASDKEIRYILGKISQAQSPVPKPTPNPSIVPIPEPSTPIAYGRPAYTSNDVIPFDQQRTNAEYIYTYLRQEKKWSKEAICALLGNIECEGILNPGQWQAEQTNVSLDRLGYGLVQWDPSRRFFEWAGITGTNDAAIIEAVNQMAINDPKKLINLQLDFVIYTSETYNYDDKRWYKTNTAVNTYGSPYKMEFSEFIISTNNSGDLALVFHGHYERSNDTSARRQKRIDFTNKWYEYFNDWE